LISNWLSVGRPGIERELPHHLQALGGGGFGKVLNVGSILTAQIGNSNF
jgi:hypothetical protein